MIVVNKKIVLIGGILIGALFLLLLIMSIKPPQVPGGNRSVSGSSESARVALNRLAQSGKTSDRLNNDQIATLILQWANNTRTEKGGYASGEDCDGEGVCQPLVINNGVGAPAMWARFRYYLKHKNVEALDTIREDIKTYGDPQKVVTIQPYFWSCKLLYEMWKNPLFTQAEKDGLQVICARSLYNAIDLVPHVASPTAAGVVGEVKADLAGHTGEETFFIGPPDTASLDEYAVNALERSAIYAWGKDESDLEQAKLYFVAAMKALHNTTDQVKAGDAAPLVGLAALELNSVMPAPELVSYAQAVYGRYKGTSCSTLQSCVMRTYFYNELYKLDKNAQYQTQRDAILTTLYDNQFDYQGTAGYFAGKQAYYDHGLNYSYDMIPNCMLTGLLMDMP